MRTYGMPYRAVLDMPIRAFWYVSGNVPRLLADERKGTLEITRAAAAESDRFTQVHEALSKAAPEPVKLRAAAHTPSLGYSPMDAQPDPDAFDVLRSLAM